MADIAPIEFLQALYPEPVQPGKLLLWTSSKRSGKKHSYWLNTLDEAARRGQQLKQSRDVYFGVALQDAKKAVEITRRRWPKIQEGSARPSEESASEDHEEPGGGVIHLGYPKRGTPRSCRDRPLP